MTDAERIASDVADRIRDLIARAEERAAAIVRDAEQEAQRIRERAEGEANRRLAEVRQAIAELESRLGGGDDTGASSEVDPGPATVPEPAPDPVPEPAPPPVPEPGPVPVPEPTPERIPEPVPPPDEGTPPSPDTGDAGDAAEPAAANGAKSSDPVAARLVAMNLALRGASREEIEARLAAEYDLDDSAALIDQVLARARR
ncbi:MAG TPA: hypothetical protein VK919_05575 [Solirubrobacterales bacterium]|nr:hypothetical protein [Solirubrobacterales bacterium]